MHWYKRVLENTLIGSHEQLNARTGHKVFATPNLFFDVPVKDRLPMPDVRRVFPHVAAAELAWTLSGQKDIAWLQCYTKMWDKFADQMTGDVQAAYGYRWRRYWQRDQLFDAIDALMHDESSRQVVVMAWDPETDGLLNQGKLTNVPCPLGFSLNVMGNELNMTLFIRSSDVVVGLPYDVLHYALLLDALVMELYKRGKRLYRGRFGVAISHAHVYDIHHNVASDMLHSTLTGEPIQWPNFAVSDILNDPDAYVAEVKMLQKGRLSEDVYQLEVVI